MTLASTTRSPDVPLTVRSGFVTPSLVLSFHAAMEHDPTGWYTVKAVSARYRSMALSVVRLPVSPAGPMM